MIAFNSNTLTYEQQTDGRRYKVMDGGNIDKDDTFPSSTHSYSPPLPSYDVISQASRERLTSGVPSVSANPVPPVVTIKLGASAPSAHCITSFWMASRLSVTICSLTTLHFRPPSSAKTSRRTDAVESVVGSWEAVVETIKIAALSGLSI